MSSEHLQTVTFVLCRTQFAANLGGAARVMANLGLERLLLVAPVCEVGAEARTMAMKGADLLDRAVILPHLELVRKEFDLLVGTAGRTGNVGQQFLTPRRFAGLAVEQSRSARIAVVFGSEDNGLRKEEIALCDSLIEIPAVPENPSLNLAQAVAIVAYELHQAVPSGNHPIREVCAPEEFRALLAKVEAMLDALEFAPRYSVDRMMERIRKMAVRAHLERDDVRLMQSVMDQVSRRLAE